MTGLQTSETELMQCLKDCGCDEEAAKQFLIYVQENRLKDQIRLLYRFRRPFLDALHDDQRRIDCIDFMIRKLEQKMKEETGGSPNENQGKC